MQKDHKFYEVFFTTQREKWLRDRFFGRTRSSTEEECRTRRVLVKTSTCSRRHLKNRIFIGTPYIRTRLRTIIREMFFFQNMYVYLSHQMNFLYRHLAKTYKTMSTKEYWHMRYRRIDSNILVIESAVFRKQKIQYIVFDKRIMKES